ncbi:MAG: hypothetical protein EP350_05260 [Alphaproteobacteria bacterium]|nr:MAG: hypothetical protein EP350_05260 [Alphaproteobacteria bacterium]
MRTLVRKQAEAEAPDVESASNQARSESVHRLQIGLSGLAAMVLLVGLANMIQDRARVAESMSVPEAAPTTEPSSQPIQSDPLADAGLVPDLPVEPSASPPPAPAGQGPKTDDVPDPRR